MNNQHKSLEEICTRCSEESNVEAETEREREREREEREGEGGRQLL
jgi:hypothetical protein